MDYSLIKYFIFGDILEKRQPRNITCSVAWQSAIIKLKAHPERAQAVRAGL